MYAEYKIAMSTRTKNKAGEVGDSRVTRECMLVLVMLLCKDFFRGLFYNEPLMRPMALFMGSAL